MQSAVVQSAIHQCQPLRRMLHERTSFGLGRIKTSAQCRQVRFRASGSDRLCGCAFRSCESEFVPVSNTSLIDQDSHSNVIWPEPSFAARRAPRGSVRSAARGHQLFCRPLDHLLRCPRYVHRDSVTALVRNAGAGLRRRRWSRRNPADSTPDRTMPSLCVCRVIPARQISRCDPRPTNPTARLREDTWFGC